MKRKLDLAPRASCLALALLALSTLNPQLSTLHAQGTAFTYQGRLTDNGAPFSGVVELDATLWDAATDGNEIRFGPLPAPPVMVEVSNGLFTVELDFRKGVFSGAPRWLQISLRKDPDPAPFTTLLPRQQILAVPYAMTAREFTGTVPNDGLIGSYSKALAFDNTNNVFVGRGDDLTDLNASALTSGTVPSEALGNAWKIGGNTGTTPGTHFLGTADNQPLELRVNGLQALRLQPGGSGLASVIGGAANNQVAPGVTAASIGGGYNNTIQGGADVGTIGGGYLNTLQANAGYATIGGGNVNTIQLNALSATVGGGSGNTIQTNTDYATIGGGWVNTIGLNSDYATLGGGSANTVEADAAFATIPGGRNNSATNYAFAAGRRAKANHTGAFVWADSQDADFLSSATNEFAVRASGGVRFMTGGAGIRLDGQPVLSGTVNTAQLADGAVLGELLDDDGAGSGLDADLLDGLSSAAFWQLGGNAGTSLGPHFLGTTDNQPLEFRANGIRALRLEPTTNGNPNVIGGAPVNYVAPGVAGATIGGGGSDSPGFAASNSIAGGHGTISGGLANTIESNAVYNTIGGGNGNSIRNGAWFATISGGWINTIEPLAQSSTVSGGWANRIERSAELATISGGWANTIQTNALHASIGGGRGNTIRVDAEGARIGGGVGNQIQNEAVRATIAGGSGNVVGSSASYSVMGGGVRNTNSGVVSVIGGGDRNTIQGNSDPSAGNWSVIGGGLRNLIESNSGWSAISGGVDNSIGSGQSTLIAGGVRNAIESNGLASAIGGGSDNLILANAFAATIGGGLNNRILANATSATVPGGRDNTATNYAFAAGRRAKASHTGSFVWADSQNADFSSTSNNQFLIRASGGVAIGTNDPAGAALRVAGSIKADSFLGMGTTLMLGTTDNQPLELKVNGVRAMRLEPGTPGQPNVIGGAEDNQVASGASGATIAGGRRNTILSGANSSTIGGGRDNTVQTDANFSTVAGGVRNVAGGVNGPSFTVASTVGGGDSNLADAPYATIGGGVLNTNTGFAATIPGGRQNVAIGAYGLAAGRRAIALHPGAFVWGDSTDADFLSSGTDQFLIRAGGGVGINLTNPMHLLHVGTTLGTGALNASTHRSVVENSAEDGRAAFLALAGPGGSSATNRVELQLEANEAQRRAIIGTTSNHEVQFRQNNFVRMQLATNGNVGINEAFPEASLHIAGVATATHLHLEQTQNNGFARLRFSAVTKPSWDLAVGGPNNVVNFFSGGGNGNVMTLTTNGNLTTAGTVNGVSDRAAKERFTPVDSREVLEKVAQLPLARWHYKTDPGVPHIGPVAQDFHAAFGVGADDKHIAAVDADGVALAAIQGLNEKVEVRSERAEGSVRELRQQFTQKLEQKDTEITELKRELVELKKQMYSIHQQLNGGTR